MNEELKKRIMGVIIEAEAKSESDELVELDSLWPEIVKVIDGGTWTPNPPERRGITWSDE